MDDMIHIFLDIEGTYSVLSDNDKYYLIELIDQIREYKNYEKCLISFASTLECSTIEELFTEDLKKYIPQHSDTIEIGPVIGCDGFLHKHKYFKLNKYLSKAEAMLVFIKREANSMGLKEVIYADDNPHINPLLLTAYLHKSKIDLPIDIISKREVISRKQYSMNSFVDNNDNFLIHGLESMTVSLSKNNKRV